MTDREIRAEIAQRMLDLFLIAAEYEEQGDARIALLIRSIAVSEWQVSVWIVTNTR